MITLRPATTEELPQLSALILRSKAYWGYDAAFMKACEDELRLTPAQLMQSDVIVACDGDVPLGTASVTQEGERCDLGKFFVDPPAMGRGVGRLIFDWAASVAEAYGATELTIEADPGAAPFYRKMGAVDVGTAPSGSIPGRVLPLLSLPLPRAQRP